MLPGASAAAHPQPSACICLPLPRKVSPGLPHCLPSLMPTMGLRPCRAEALSASSQSNQCLQNWVMLSQCIAPKERKTEVQGVSPAVQSEGCRLGCSRGPTYTFICLGLAAEGVAHLAALPGSEQLPSLLTAPLPPAPGPCQQLSHFPCFSE